MIRKLRSNLSVKVFITIALLLTVSCSLIYGAVMLVIPRTYKMELNSQFDEAFSIMMQRLNALSYRDGAQVIYEFTKENNAAVTIEWEDAFDVVISSDSDIAAFFADQSHNTVPRRFCPLCKKSMSWDDSNSQWHCDHCGLHIEISDGAALWTEAEVFYVEATDYVSSTMEGIVTDVIVATSPVTIQNSAAYAPAVITATTTLTAVNDVAEVLNKILPYGILFILLISLAGAIFVSRFLAKPVVEISGIAKKMSSLDLSWRCNTARTDELGMLAGSLNEMAESLDTAMTDLKRANKVLLQDIDRERAQEEQRRNFFAAVSHELKTPITILKGEIEGMIYKVGIYKDREKYLRHSLETTESIENLVREILEVSKLEADNFTPKLTKVNLSEMVGKCCDNYRAIAESDEKKTRFDCLLQEDIDLIADSRLLEKAMSNIMGNAIFHSPKRASVQVKLTREESKAVLSVENTGAHIRGRDMERIFEAFYRVDRSRNRHTGGSGLGLYIVRVILDIHNAEYSFKNTPGGVCFTATFNLPTA